MPISNLFHKGTSEMSSFRKVVKNPSLIPIVNIINEYYVRDGSKKVRTSLRLKGESGEHLTTIPPYGYVKDPDNSEHWLVDPEATQVVKRIFSLCMDGNGPTQIARMLKEDHV